MSEREKRNPRATLTILAVVAAFVVPNLLAWWFALIHPPSVEDSLINHGTLLRPSLDTGSRFETASLSRIELAPGEWAMVYVGPGTCDDGCKEVLSKLATIRSVLGQAVTRVRTAALLDEEPKEALSITVVADEVARSYLTEWLADRIRDASPRGIIFLDWRRQVMMYFETGAPPGDIKKDIKRLLRASKIK